EAAVLLKSISSGHSVERKTAYVNMEGISLELEDILVCSPEGDQKHSALLKDKFTDESTVFDVVSALGPGYVPPISGTGSITWFFDDGSQIVTRFWPENLHSKIVRNYK
ncbi:MAG: hypothetical protein KC618_09280, partial [Candidatus Omnitrophica bacterium]|nr:hypothetical protein [Candidatus Omnitrophota bacterium]